MSTQRPYPLATFSPGEGVEVVLVADAAARELPHEQVCSICRAEIDRVREVLQRPDVARPTWEDD